MTKNHDEQSPAAPVERVKMKLPRGKIVPFVEPELGAPMDPALFAELVANAPPVTYYPISRPYRKKQG